MKFRACIAMVLPLALTSCASTPDVTLGYFHARGTADLAVTRTLVCNKKQHVIEVVTTDFQPKFVADPAWVPFNVKAVEGAMSNSDVTLGYYDDGRLKSVNTESEGQAGEILKSTVTAITSIATILGLDGGGLAPFPAACKEIKSVGDGKPVVISYKKVGLDPTGNAVIDVPVASGSEAHQMALKQYIGSVCAKVIRSDAIAQSSPAVSASDTSPKLQLIQPGTATVEVRTGKCTGDALATHKLVAPQFGHEFYLPVPKARAFGKQTFALELAESGVITKVRYARETGANEGLTVLNAALPELEGSTAEERAKATNAKADEIAANARLAKCIADPDNCS